MTGVWPPSGHLWRAPTSIRLQSLSRLFAKGHLCRGPTSFARPRARAAGYSPVSATRSKAQELASAQLDKELVAFNPAVSRFVPGGVYEVIKHLPAMASTNIGSRAPTNRMSASHGKASLQRHKPAHFLRWLYSVVRPSGPSTIPAAPVCCGPSAAADSSNCTRALRALVGCDQTANGFRSARRVDLLATPSIDFVKN
jgi:hypothetical protein